MSGKLLDVATRIELPRAEIAALCLKHHVKELALFGSVVSADFGPSSDVDFLVRFIDDDAGPWMSHLTSLQEELSRALGRAVDVVDWPAVEKSRNPFRRNSILRGAQILYAA